MIKPFFKLDSRGRIIPIIEFVGESTLSAVEWAGLIHLLHSGVYGKVLKDALQTKLKAGTFDKIQKQLDEMTKHELHHAFEPIIKKIKLNDTTSL